MYPLQGRPSKELSFKAESCGSTPSSQMRAGNGPTSVKQKPLPAEPCASSALSQSIYRKWPLHIKRKIFLVHSSKPRKFSPRNPTTSSKQVHSLFFASYTNSKLNPAVRHPVQSTIHKPQRDPVYLLQGQPSDLCFYMDAYCLYESGREKRKIKAFPCSSHP